MTGEDLYNLWVDAMAFQRVQVDDFEFLGDREQQAWEDVAEQVEEKTL